MNWADRVVHFSSELLQLCTFVFRSTKVMFNFRSIQSFQSWLEIHNSRSLLRLASKIVVLDFSLALFGIKILQSEKLFFFYFIFAF